MNKSVLESMTMQEAQEYVVQNWGSFAGGYEGGMTPKKLVGRMENAEWNPPIFRFQIERHGGLMMGSSRAEVQIWQVDLDNMTADIIAVGHRQIRPMAPRIYINPIVAETVDAILNRKSHDRIKWINDNEVRVLTCEIFPARSAVQRTLDDRRSRFRAGLSNELAQVGWRCQRGHGFEICTPVEH